MFDFTRLEKLHQELKVLDNQTIHDRDLASTALTSYKSGEISLDEMQKTMNQIFTPEFFQRGEKLAQNILEQRKLMGLD